MYVPFGFNVYGFHHSLVPFLLLSFLILLKKERPNTSLFSQPTPIAAAMILFKCLGSMPLDHPMHRDAMAVSTHDFIVVAR
jgi:hypothetical protein